MDSKQKFIRNRYWKKKFRPRNATVNTHKSLEHKKKDSSAQFEEECEDEFMLYQPIPKEGWFPEYDSSSDSENLDSLANAPHIVSTSTLKNENNKKCDINWFDRELDNIQLNSEVNAVENSKDKSLLTQENQTITSNIKINITKEKNDPEYIDNEEAELEFLLSLKEPIFTGPLVVKKNIENERRITSNNCVQQKPVKSIDLEKWLDTVLDN